MRKIRNFFLYLMLFVGALMFFTPKVQLYYALEKELKEYGVIVSSEKVDDTGLRLSIFGADLYVQGILSAHIQEVNVGLFGLYNSVSIKSIELAKTFRAMVPTKIEHAELTYSIISPLKVQVAAEGDFGEIRGYVDVVERLVHIELTASKLMKRRYSRSLKQFKKLETGGLEYESRF